ncbi:hypothetical protein [Rhodococcoides yunnanense]|uniref:Uncharacterized protein n=1 Tax=Rhodococcoides yunnanense TaxID=278209 RepID=A0ABU4BI62_9NOCA|nr:hypothetical protein [Rhodococcus yunnanensis]MDV6263890.1 hypothetical protein [Rhodococcus yunnanensis]
MKNILGSLIEELSQFENDDVIRWACPVPFFGDLPNARIATVGINPSNREFADSSGKELRVEDRRLATLNSLGLFSWDQASEAEVTAVSSACRQYFDHNPYAQWFNVLDRLLGCAGYSYYGGEACHLDLVAYATRTKWGLLSAATRERMLADGRASLASLLRDSRLETLVLNGRSVVREFEQMARTEFSRVKVDGWELPRATGRAVDGYRYEQKISSIDDFDLGREISVIGYNHNLQSSFGVTKVVMEGIGRELGEGIRGFATCS